MNRFKATLLLSCAAASGLALFAAQNLIVPAQAAPGTACKPKLDGGPLPMKAVPSGPVGEGPFQKEDEQGLIGQEFFISCTGSAGPYKTLIRVVMPKDPNKRSGFSMVEPDASVYRKTFNYMSRAGHIAIAVISAPSAVESLKKSDPAKYGSLNIPSGPESGFLVVGGQVFQTPMEFEVLAQAGEFIKSGGIPGVRAGKVILAGMSSRGAVVRNYMEWEHPRPGMKSVFDGYFPTQGRKTGYKGPLPDMDVPIIDLEGERELEVLPYAGEPTITYRRPDGPLFRLYEVPGMPHDITRGAPPTAFGADKCVGGYTLSNFPNQVVFSATLAKLVAWVEKGVAPPSVPWIETSADGKQIKRDQFGNALGGYRISYVDVPINTYHSLWAKYSVKPRVSPGPDPVVPVGPSDKAALDCDKIGWMEPLSKAQLQKLYPTHDDYVAKVSKSLDASVASGLMLPQDAKDLLEEARMAKIP
jgi:hypothetical protein